MAELQINDLTVEVEGEEILHGVDLALTKGETHALMGPNGSGKSTLAYAIAGHPAYRITGGNVVIDGTDIGELTPDERAQLGLFLAMQYPTEIPGVSLTNFLRTSLGALRGQSIPVRQFMTDLKSEFERLDMNPAFMQRNVNEGFSGGEKKRFEILQMAMIKPRYAVLDETDSGLDIDALRVVSEGVNRLRGDDIGVLLITHYTRILRYITPDRVHVMFAGRIVEFGGPELADELEEHGYERLRVQS
jgi:Fe-S cluster assembly ATP-binding protein